MTTPARADEAERLSADERRERLLDVSRDLVLAGGDGSVTMGSVAEGAGVTRALVYKHFGNRDDVLLALYRREAGRIDRAMQRAVLDAPDGLEAKLRTLAEVVLDSMHEHGPFFQLLRNVSFHEAARRDQRDWDRRSVRYFARLAHDELGIDERTARAAIAQLLTGLSTLRVQVSARPADRGFYVETFLGALLGGLHALAARPG